MRYSWAVLLLCCLCGFCHADTLQVPAQYASIQTAIDAAADGDTVLVAPGTYFENINFLGKDIVVISSNGAEVTVIDGGMVTSVVSFENGEPLTATLEGFTITNGDEISGSGIYCRLSSATIRSNLINYNGFEIPDYGKAVSGVGLYIAQQSEVVIENNDIMHNSIVRKFGGTGGGIHAGGDCIITFIGNRVSHNKTISYMYNSGFGGGVSLSSSQVTVRDNEITFNESGWSGGGMRVKDCSGIVENNLISDNLIKEDGAGLVLEEHFGAPLLTVRNNTICNNRVTYGGNYLEWGGAGIYVINADPLIINNRIYGNDAGFQGGGGIGCVEDAHPTLVNNLIYDNQALFGAGIYCYDNSDPLLMNNTIVANHAAPDNGYGGGIFCLDYSDPQGVNTIFWGNTASDAQEICLADHNRHPSTLTLDYSTVAGGEAGAFIVVGCELFWGQQMLSEDPQLVDPENHDYHLSRLSPCINRGTLTGAPADDGDGDPRPFMGAVDMGYDEFAGLHPLETDRFTLPVGGGSVYFSLDAGTEEAGRNYLLLGSMSGNIPGLPLPGGLKILPLNWDGTTDFVLSRLNSPVCTDFLAPLNGAGQGSASLNVTQPNPNQLGKVMTFAYCLEGMPDWNFVSNPVPVEWVP